ncbi:hypothetical protein H9P43_003221 [Blastocladiella emersonii ATCC 22665]|nr:hypothetical protein H9P43_003221 [Blastocladiella emersonii ATCC 22665]
MPLSKQRRALDPIAAPSPALAPAPSSLAQASVKPLPPAGARASEGKLEVKGVGGPTPPPPVPAAVRRPSQSGCKAGCRCGKCASRSSTATKPAAPPRPPRKLEPVQRKESTTTVTADPLPPVPVPAAEPAPPSPPPSVVPAATVDPHADVFASPLERALSAWPFALPQSPDEIVSIKLTHLMAALEYAASIGKCPVILDKSGKIDVFFAHRHCTVVECKPLVLDVFFRHTSSAVDAARHIADRVRAAMRVGAYLLLRCTDAAPSFTKLAAATQEPPGDDIGDAIAPPPADVMDAQLAWFPFPGLFDPAELTGDATVRKLDPLNLPGTVRKANDEPLVPRDGFQVLVTSSFDPEDAREFLAPSLPLGRCLFFHVADPNN